MKFKNESGRSMVEMLGVLAIIGVLSIGGIAGYTLAMDRFRANELIDLANKYASLAYSTKATAEMKGLTFTPATFAFNDCGLGTLDQNNIAQTGWIQLPAKVDDAFPDVGDDGKRYVNVNVTFQSKDICETAANILGMKLESTTCATHALTISIKQN